MGSRIRMDRTWNESGDTAIIMILILLAGTGLSALFTASFYFSENLFQDPWYLLNRQILWLGLGAAAALAVSRIPLSLIRGYLPYMIAAAAVLNLLTLAPGIGTEALGARRWIVIFGQSFQPSELAKACLILYLAHIFSKNEDRIDDLRDTILPPLLVVFLFVGIVYVQNDFSTAAFIFLVAFAMFFVAGIRVGHLFLITLFSAGAAGIMVMAKPHRLMRVITWINPQRDPGGAGYQILSARRALEEGGFSGVGVGQGLRKLGGLPEAHSDFVFAVMGEELGFAGVAAIIVLFTAFAVRGYTLAERSQSSFNRYLAFGVTTSIYYQALLNMAVVSGMVPATGIPLPFFSAGGSSLFMTLALTGLLVNVSRSVSGSPGGYRPGGRGPYG